MKNRRFAEIPEALREGWEPTDAGKAWVELLGPHVPEDVRRWNPNTDSGVLLSDPSELLAADNAFAAAIQRSMDDRVIMPVLQVMTNTYFLSQVPHEGDCLMFHCPRASETAEVVVWNHETHEFYGPVAYDLPTMMRLAEVADSGDDVEQRRAALAPCLGRWKRESFPMSLFEDALMNDDVWSVDDDWPAIEAPNSAYQAIANRAWWVSKALINSNPETEHIKAHLDWTPDKAFTFDYFQDSPMLALYWLWRTYFLGEDEWHRTALARCKQSQSRLIRDAAAYAEAECGKGALAEWRKNAIDFVEHVRNPFPARVQVGNLEMVRDDGLATLEPPEVSVPEFKCEPGQTLNAWWQAKTRIAVPHPDSRRWLVDGRHDHPRKGKHPSIPNSVEALFEVDPETGKGSLFCDIADGGSYIKWAEYVDEDRVLLISNGRLRLYQRVTGGGSGRAYLLDQVQLGQEKALFMRGLGLIMGYGGIPLMGEKGWETRPERLSGARLVDGRLRRSGDVELALAYVADHDGVLVGRNEDRTAGYRLEGLVATPAPDRIVFKPTAFVVPEKVWRAGPNPVLDALGPQDVCIETPAGLCLINRLVTEPPGARRAYVGNAEGIRAVEPAFDLVGYAIESPTAALAGSATEVYRIDLETGAATLVFDFPAGGSWEPLKGGFLVLAGGELQARTASGEITARVRVDDGAAMLTPIHGQEVVAMKTATSPLALVTVRDGAIHLLGALRPDGELAGVTFEYPAVTQWLYHILAKAPDGTRLDLRGVSTALADAGYGVRLEREFPAQPWDAAPEITRG